ncbi:MAG: hypothetical protein ACLFPD_08370 [Desulfosudaceae bacterium]
MRESASAGGRRGGAFCPDENCRACTRYYCPFGIDISALIVLARQVCRSQGITRENDREFSTE